VRETAKFNTGCCFTLGAEQGLIADIIIDQQVALPSPKELARVTAASAGLVIEGDDPRDWLQVIAAISPQVSFFGFAFAGVELRHRRLVGMKGITLQQEPGEAVGQRLQGNADAANPFCQGGAGEDDLATGGDLLQPVEREMIQVFGCYRPSQQTHRRHTAIYHGGRNRCGSDGHTTSTGILRVDVAVDEELGRFDIQLFGDVFANLDQFPATLAAGARFRLVPVLDARRMVRQGLATCAGPFGFGYRIAWLPVGQLFDFRFDGRKVSVNGFLEHIPLQWGQGFALDPVADTPDMGQLMAQCLDFLVFELNFSGFGFKLGILCLKFELFGLKCRNILLCLLKQCLNDLRHLGFGGGIDVQMIKFDEWIHGLHYTL
jgi:hypothetical protein